MKMKTELPEESKTSVNNKDADISFVSTRLFGFQVGKHVMDIEAKSEQEAMQKLDLPKTKPLR